jgi:tetratricopeptide (TPR) repeat protein
LAQITRALFTLLVLQVLLAACAPTKSREDQGPLAKAWHNTNAHYNGYFNASEIIDESLVRLSEQYGDNYNQRLKMFPFLAVDNPGAVAGELDRAIEKVAIVVRKHPYSNWTDDSYLLVGKAQLIKQDYESAEKTLRFAMTEFRPRPKRKKTRDGEEVDEEEFESRREIEANEAQTQKDKLQARRDAQRERIRTIKQRRKEQRAAQKQRDRERKERIRARKKGIRLPRTETPPDSLAVVGLENEPEEEEVTELEEGPIGMISIFSSQQTTGGGEAYGNKAGSYLLKHRPAYQEIRLWLAWTYIKRDKFDRAQIILDDLRNDRGTFADVRRKAIAVQAYAYLEQDRLEEAIPYLEAAAEVATERNERARYYYIAGQLYQELGQSAAALAAFQRVVDARPVYDLELGARISVAQNSYLSSGGSPAAALRTLERMAREEKNLPYESQIYYSMAGIAMRSGDEEAGARYLRRALDSPYGGATTRVEAYQLLGDMAYTERDYLSAKLYYDSTLQVMSREDARYATTTDRRDRLTGVADNLQLIERQDSLLRIGLLPEADRRRWAEEIFELRRATNAAANFSTPVTSGSLPVRNAAADLVTNSSFWGYDNQAIRRGRRDFARRWGDRPLEDNWRRRNRTDAALFTDPGDGLSTELEPSDLVIVTEDEINKILTEVPLDSNAQQQARRDLATAYFNLGRDYRDRIEDGERAVEAFRELENRYPGEANEAESWYYLYLLHKEAGDASGSATYARKLATTYPDSRFAKLANDPGYAAKLTDEEGQRTRAYERAYTSFEAGDYEDADRRAAAGEKALPAGHPLRARYALLRAMITGKLQGRPAYVSALQQVVAQHDNTPEQTRAREILRLLGEGGASLPGRGKAGAGGGNFKESMDEIHYILITFTDPEIKLNDIKVELADYHEKYHKLDRLRSTPIYIGTEEKTPVLVVRRFKTGQEAMTYYRNGQQNDTEFLGQSKPEFAVYPVSQTNYREILKARSFAGYGEWFDANY